MNILIGKKVSVGDRLIVHGCPEVAIVEKVEQDDKTKSWVYYLDWGALGKSRVMSHDEGTVWRLYNEIN